MEGAPHDAKAMDVEEFTIEGSVKIGEVDNESLEGGWANLQERAFRRRNSMWNFMQCAENLTAFHYSNQAYNGGS